ncbi:MAG: phospholipase/Carboxylesterase [Acidimicrobiales bacterium]|nr:phospholipase/Carboxylesterase [Acidimicrobiales bacterium]
MRAAIRRPGARRSWSVVPAVAVSVALLTGTAACSSSEPAAKDTTSATGPGATAVAGPVAASAPMGTYAVARAQFDLTDPRRPTPANNGVPGSEVRKLPTVAFYPAVGKPVATDRGTPEAVDGAAARDGRYPLVVFSHGLSARGIFYAGQLAALASAGYVVIAPDYPLSNANTPGGHTVSDVGNQPGDASFLIDTFTAADAEGPPAAVTTHVDGRHVGAVGHSLGAITSLGLGYSTCCADHRIGAVVSWAGVFLPLHGQRSPEAGITDRPLLLIHGDQDRTVAYRYSQSAFAKVESPRWFITLRGQGHGPPFVTPGTGPVARLVTTATIDFLDAHLKDDPDGIDRLSAAVAEAGAGVAALQVAGR